MKRPELRRVVSSILFAIFTTVVTSGFAQNQAKDGIMLQFSDGQADVIGFENTNAILTQIGVHASLINIP